MRAVVQRVSEALVSAGGQTVGAIALGLLVYLGVAPDDVDTDVEYIVDKVRHLRIFPDDQERMNRDVVEVGGKILLVSAFTVQADARKGRRPSFDSAAKTDFALAMYEKVCSSLVSLGVAVERGSFGDYMEVRSTNAGPVCVLLDSKRMI